MILETFIYKTWKYISSPWYVISLYGLGCNIVLQLGDFVKGVNGGAVILITALQLKKWEVS